ncbi:hypothetical protein KEU06_25405 [Pseudaminobacter sp. 19-2017]|uniref:Uncharacterized protein n=1 Tax=Pseudaminobacter soli (ex Zhang et al. 2022) TaxID=2831468 RepID=A0A942I3X1_9HYPH|nr:hypothetical protein [Pseudaminobacter soli]MBS3651947.1 hypothetical protein [Pseudaminobacter soli]
MSESSDADDNKPAPGVLAGNVGEPIKLTDLTLAGVSAEAARGGDTIKIWTRLSLTSDDRHFYRIVENFAAHVEHMARKAGHHVSLSRYGLILLVIRPDNTGKLWLDAAAVSMNILAKRAMKAGTVIFENDIADVTAMSFPLVEIGKQDRVLCIFREGWRFALFFDFNPDGDLSIEDMERDLGTLHRRLKYRDLYDAIADQNVFRRLIEAGWFPFVEILGREFRELTNNCEAGFELGEVEAKLLAAFDTKRVEAMFARWMAKPHFAGKERLLRSALNNFTAGDSIAVLKIVLTEIEGILSAAYHKAHGKGARLKRLLEFATMSAEKKAGQPDTLLFPAAFAHYLKSHTFAEFDPVARTGKASSRHAVGHGAADDDSYTQVRALQALLTLDQLAFYT